MKPLLETKDICASYYKKEVLRGISIAINEGEIVALIGPNGAGKSTLVKVISGSLNPTRGNVYFQEYDITSWEQHMRIAMGMAYFIQGGEIFKSMTVDENLEMGCIKRQKAVSRIHQIEERNVISKDEIYSLFPNLRDKQKTPAALLSGGERQALALGIVLMINPKILLLDEPSAGLSPALIKDVMEKIKKINKEWQITILIIEQNVGEVLTIAHRAYIMKLGSIFKEGDAHTLLMGKTLEKAFWE